MPKANPSDNASITEILAAAGTTGLSPEELARQLSHISRSTVNRRLSALVSEGTLKTVGTGRGTRYVSASPLSLADVDAYFRKPWNQRPVAVFKEELLQASPGIDPKRAQRLKAIQSIATPLDLRFLTNFIIDFSWGSSTLEGGTYSALDTEALVLYGQKNKDKPTADALLVLNHKTAAEYLWKHREVSVANICAMHALVTHDHGLADVADSGHFLPEHQRGKPREYEEVNLAVSAYLPPFRPGTAFAAHMLEGIVQQARELHPVEAALYLLTRIPYVQIFANGNKRASRLAANAALLAGGLLPFSFADVDKADYIRGMAAFYELGSTLLIEKTLVEGYARSVVRGSDIPVRMRTQGFDVETVARELVKFVVTGKRPADKRAVMFLR